MDTNGQVGFVDNQQGANPEGSGFSTMPGAKQGEFPHAGIQATKPQPGGFYQYQSGVGFVQVSDGSPSMNAPGMGQSAQPAAHGTPEGAEPKFDQNKLGEVYGMVNDAMNGDVDTSKLLNLLSDTGGDFWKGALVGAAAVFLLNNEAVKNAVGGTFGSFFGNEDAGEKTEKSE